MNRETRRHFAKKSGMLRLKSKSSVKNRQEMTFRAMELGKEIHNKNTLTAITSCSEQLAEKENQRQASLNSFYKINTEVVDQTPEGPLVEHGSVVVESAVIDAVPETVAPAPKKRASRKKS